MFTLRPVTPRISKIRKRNRDTLPTVTTERFRIVTDFYKEHPDLPIQKKRALLFKKMCEEMPTPVHEGELIAGNVTAVYRGSALYPDTAAWMFENFKAVDPRERELDPYDISDEDLAYIMSEEDFWLANNASKKMDNSITPGFWKILGNGVTTFGVDNLCTTPVGHYCSNFDKAINVGFAAIKAEADAKMAEMDGKLYGDLADKYRFYEAISIVCEGIIIYSKRYGAECRRQAEACADEARKAELLQMADSFEWIMENPCRTFWEAIQCVFLYQMAQALSEALHGTSFGRIDQYLAKFYEQDIAQGTLTEDFAQELIDSFCLKVSEQNRVSAHIVTYAIGGYTSGQLITLGGVKPEDGSDASNGTTYHFLQSAARLNLHDPPMSLRIHKNTPDDLWEAAVETTKRNGGVPTFENDDVIIPSLVDTRKMSLEDARNYCLIGCVEPAGTGCDWSANGGPGQESFWLMPNALTLAINNGYNPMPQGPEQIITGQTGLATGYLYEMETFDEVLAALKAQMDYFVDWQVSFTNIHEYVAAENMPLPVVSATMDGCMESGKDVMWGGAKYNSTGAAAVGLGTLVDSLAVIKYMVYDKKLISAKDFLQAVVTNWEGQEELRQRVHTEVPRYGNDLPYADELASWVVDTYCERVLGATGPRGNHWVPGLYPVATHVLYGMLSWATPDGRKTGEPLSDGISPKQQMDTSGPLAVLKSASSFDHKQCSNGTLLNMKFHPKSLEGEGLDKFKALTKTYFDMGGMEMQFNVVSADTLRAAQENPEEYKDLVVRIAGFSAYFVELYKGMQDDVIERTEVAL